MYTVVQSHARDLVVTLGQQRSRMCAMADATVLLFLTLSGFHIKTSVIRFVCPDSHYGPTAVFEGQHYGLPCIRLADKKMFCKKVPLKAF